MGHASVETTEKYVDIVDDDVQKEYNKLDMGNELHRSSIDECCEICNTQANLQEHHYSYDPPKTIDVCNPCHAEIHHSERHDQLLPDMTQEEARQRGLVE
jgi:hypothetical protein